MKDFLTSLYNVGVTVLGANVSRFAKDWMEKLTEMKKQSKVLKEIKENLKGFGGKVAEENMKKNKLQCTFRSTVTASQDAIQE